MFELIERFFNLGVKTSPKKKGGTGKKKTRKSPKKRGGKKKTRKSPKKRGGKKKTRKSPKKRGGKKKTCGRTAKIKLIELESDANEPKWVRRRQGLKKKPTCAQELKARRQGLMEKKRKMMRAQKLKARRDVKVLTKLFANLTTEK